MRAGGRAVAIESEAGRVAMIAHNAARLGVPRLEIVTGAAPAALAGLEGTPDAIFIGGGISSPGLIEACWRALAPGGRLVSWVMTKDAARLSLNVSGPENRGTTCGRGRRCRQPAKAC